jgi:ATP-dependent Clp protease ATP-binding subunit ClpB
MQHPIQLNRAGKQAEDLQKKLRSFTIGQHEATNQIVDVCQTYLSGLVAHGRPIGKFLFLGPTGSGKTRTVETTAEVLTENPRSAATRPYGIKGDEWP